METIISQISKDLFLNLEAYYKITEENLQDCIPATFLIKNGYEDESFVNFLNKTKLSSRQMIVPNINELQSEKDYWIIKPGENSNRGQGIEV